MTAYQLLNILIVVGDTLDVSWAFPECKTDGVKGAPAQDQTFNSYIEVAG